MNPHTLKIIAVKTYGLGYNNQLSGLIKASRPQDCPYCLPKISQSLIAGDDGSVLHRCNYQNNAEFEKAVYLAVNNYISTYEAPDIILLSYDHARINTEAAQTDLLSLYLKSAFSAHGYYPKTLVLNSPLYKYKNVDFIHIGKHLLNDDDERKLTEFSKSGYKIITTLGVPSNLTRSSVKMAALKPLYLKIQNDYGTFKILGGQMILRHDNVAQARRNRKNILFSVGGKTEDDAIKFTLNDATNLLNAAVVFSKNGYYPIFSNTPRTPTDVTDFLYEQCQKLNFDFFNSKKICKTSQEAANFRNYNGKYKDIFQKQIKDYGRVYPAILDVCEIVVNTHDSFSYTSDAATLGITSLVYTGNFIDKKLRYDCYKLFDLCQAEGYVMDLQDALLKLENHEKISTIKMPDVNSQILEALCKLI